MYRCSDNRIEHAALCTINGKAQGVEDIDRIVFIKLTRHYVGIGWSAHIEEFTRFAADARLVWIILMQFDWQAK